MQKNYYKFKRIQENDIETSRTNRKVAVMVASMAETIDSRKNMYDETILY